jgi:Skp family chaperone for outer membrane proteins
MTLFLQEFFMKKLTFLISTLLISSLNAQTMPETLVGAPAGSVTMQLAFVDLRLILGDDLTKTPHEWRDRMMALQHEAESRMNRINADVEKYQRLQNEYANLRNKKNTFVDSAAINAKEEELAKLEKDIKIAQQSAQGYTNNMSQQIYADMIGKIEKVVKEIAKTRNYLIVFAGPVALYVNPAIDITTDVIAELNKQYKPKKETKAPVKPEQKAGAAA